MTILQRLGQHLILTIHTLTDEEVRIRRGLRYGGYRAGIRAVGKLQAAARRSQHHLRGVGSLSGFDGFSLLQAVPVFQRYSQFTSPRRIKTPGAGQSEAVAIARHTVVQPECADITLQKIHQLRFRLQLTHPDIKGEIRGNGAQRIHRPLRAHRSYNRKLLCASLVTHGQQQTRKPGYMVGMQVGQQYLIHRFECNACPLSRKLCALSAINKNGVPLIAHHQ